MSLLIQTLVELSLLLAAMCLSVGRALRTAIPAWRWFALLLCTAFATEMVALYFNIRYRNDLLVYAVAKPVLLLLTALYFDASNPFLHKYRIGLGVGILAVLLDALWHYRFRIPWQSPDGDFSLVESIVTLALALSYFFYVMVSARLADIPGDPHFWIAAATALYCCGTFLAWIVSGLMEGYHAPVLWLHRMYFVVFMATSLYYAAICYIFYRFHPQKTASHE